MRRHKSYSEFSFDFRNRTQKVGKIYVGVPEIVTVTVDVLPEKSYFLVAVFYQFFAFGDYAFGRAASFASSHVRDDAVSAKIIATVIYVYPCVGKTRTRHGSCFVVDISVGIENGRNPLFLGDFLAKFVFEVGDIVRSENHVDVLISFFQIFGKSVLLRHATRYHDEKVFVFLFQFLHFADVA